jgi:hypothetical protein
MPLLRIDVIEGRSEAELKELLDAIQGVTFAAFKVPHSWFRTRFPSHQVRRRWVLLRPERPVV